LKASKENTLIATIILPVADENEAQQISRSVIKSTDSNGNYTLSFSKGGKKFRYLYRKGADGLILDNTSL